MKLSDGVKVLTTEKVAKFALYSGEAVSLVLFKDNVSKSDLDAAKLEAGKSCKKHTGDCHLTTEGWVFECAPPPPPGTDAKLKIYLRSAKVPVPAKIAFKAPATAPTVDAQGGKPGDPHGSKPQAVASSTAPVAAVPKNPQDSVKGPASTQVRPATAPQGAKPLPKTPQNPQALAKPKVDDAKAHPTAPQAASGAATTPVATTPALTAASADALAQGRREVETFRQAGFLDVKPLEKRVDEFEALLGKCTSTQAMDQAAAGFQKQFADLLKTARKDKAKEVAAWEEYDKALSVAKKRKSQLDALLHAGDSQQAIAKVIADVESERLKGMDLADGGKTIQAFKTGKAGLKATKKIRDDGRKEHVAGRAARVKDQEKLPKFTKRMDKLTAYREELKGLPGTGDTRNKFDKLASDVQKAIQVEDDGLTTLGAAKASKMLKTIDEEMKAARITSAAYQAQVRDKPLAPATLNAHANSKKLLADLAEKASEYLVQSHQQTVAALYERAVEGQQDDNDLAKEFDAVNDTMTQDLTAHEAAKKACDDLSKSVKEGLVALTADSDKGTIFRLKKQAAEAAERAAERDYPGAEQQYKQLQADIAQQTNTIQAQSAFWANTKKKLPEIKTSFSRLAQWPALAGPIAEASADIAAFEKLSKQRNFIQAKKLWKQLLKLEATLLKEVKDLFTFDQLDAFGKARNEAGQSVAAQVKSVRDALDELRKLAADIEEAGPIKALGEIEETWRVALRSPPKEGYDTAIVTLKTAREKSEADLAAVARQIEAAQSDPATRAQIQQDAQAAREQNADFWAPKEIAQKIGKLEATGEDVKDLFKKNAELTLLHKSDRAKAGPEWKKLLAETDARLNKRTAETAANKAEVEKAIEDDRASLKKQANASTAKFLVEVDRELEALQGLIDSGDPELMEAAEAERKKIVERAKAGIQAGDDGYQGVAKRADALNKLVNEKVLGKRLPTTQKALIEEVVKTNASCQKLLPAEALKELDTLEAKINEKIDHANKEQEIFVSLDVRRKALSKNFKKTAALAGVRVSAKVLTKDVPLPHDFGYFEKRFKAQMAEVKKYTKTEDKLSDASKLIDLMEKELAAIADAPDRRAALEAADAQVHKNKQQVHRWYQDWKAAKQRFKQVELAQAIKAVEAAGKAGRPQEIDDLRKLLSSAGKLVKNYEDPDPELIPSDLKKIRGNFQTAHNILAKATSGASRIAKNPGGTKIRARQGLQALNEAWKKSALKFNEAATRLLKSIRDEAGSDPPKQIADDVAVVSKRLTRLATLFSVEAFTKDIATLSNDESDVQTRKAARESALKTFRAYRQRVVKDAFLNQAADPDNPFFPIHVQRGFVLLALKNVERSIIGAV